ncbi:tyrosine recombinase XerC [Lysobacter korlensis]|uniref:Tyrosine recombinase XerC n=1 Tax=Lysobacter korlensis TaxID=553636 RepID=A0ABV6RKH3_9GAMM
MLDPHPEGRGNKAHTVAQASARLSDLHVIAEQRAGAEVRGTIAFVMDCFHASLAFKGLAASTQKHYSDYAGAIRKYPLKNGLTLGAVVIDKLTPGGVRRVIDVIAQGRPAERPGEAATPGYPTKANHWLRYLRRVVGWGVEHDHCTTNPFRGVKAVKEKRDHRMPEAHVFRAVQAYARACSLRQPREKGCLPPYLWAAMELAYQARLRGIEVLTLTDAHDLGDELQTNRRKGSRDNIVRKGSLTVAAVTALRERREAIWQSKRRAVPLQADQRFLFVGEDGEPLTRSGFNTAWGRMMRQAVKDGVLAEEDRFGLHGLKHRGITDTKGNKKQASGHVTDAMLNVYDHELPRVEPAGDN